MTHQIRNCRKRLHYPKCSSTIRRLVHETDSNFVVLADEDITKTMNRPMPVRIIRHSSAENLMSKHTYECTLILVPVEFTTSPPFHVIHNENSVLSKVK